MKEYIIGINKSVSKYTQFNYFIDLENKYYENNDKNEQINIWIKNNIAPLLFICILNLYCLVK